MSRVCLREKSWRLSAVVVLCCLVLSVGAWAQTSVSTEVRRGEVVYVAGDDLVVRAEDGQIKHYNIPKDFRFTVDGRQLSASELRPGMRLTQTITTTETPKTVQSVQTITGRVWFVAPPKTVVLTLPNNTNKTFTVPEGTQFTANGRPATVFELKKGDRITATIVTRSTETQVTQSNVVAGQAPPPRQVAAAVPSPLPTPTMVGVLLIEAPPIPEAEMVASAQLPRTASSIPLIGFLGVLALGISLGLMALRRRTA